MVMGVRGCGRALWKMPIIWEDFADMSIRHTHLEVDLDAIRHNVGCFREAAGGAKVLAVV